jgi:hypothetical protein
MDATSSPDKHLLLAKLARDYPQYHFRSGREFRWSPSEKTVYFVPKDVARQEGTQQLLHELGHALLGHTAYHQDVELLSMEASAWHKASALAKIYRLPLKQEEIQQCLDSYRQWLLSRSLCPSCNQTGVQKNKSTYQCINCGCSWRVNDAKHQSLRRYRLN